MNEHTSPLGRGESEPTGAFALRLRGSHSQERSTIRDKAFNPPMNLKFQFRLRKTLLTAASTQRQSVLPRPPSTH